MATNLDFSFPVSKTSVSCFTLSLSFQHSPQTMDPPSPVWNYESLCAVHQVSTVLSSPPSCFCFFVHTFFPWEKKACHPPTHTLSRNQTCPSLCTQPLSRFPSFSLLYLLLMHSPFPWLIIPSFYSFSARIK